jgi:hypothetical protein
LLGYCMLGSDDYTRANGTGETAAAEARLCHAIEGGESLDARLAMLTLFARVIHPDVVERFELKLE